MEAGRESCDVLVLGSGAGGLATAITARLHGLDVILVEKAPLLGGTTAWSGGWMWLPANPVAARDGVQDSLGAARRYLENEVGEGLDPAKVEAFLENGAPMLEYFERHTALRCVPGLATPDFHPASPGSAIGRPVCAAPIDGRELGPLIHKLRPPLREITVAGMPIAAGADLRHFMNALGSVSSALHVAKRFTRHFLDVLRHGRDMHLVNGNALAARLIKSAADSGVALRESSPARRLVVEGGAVVGAVVQGPDGAPREIRARRGVVLACGGFPHDLARRRQLFPHMATGEEHWSVAPDSNTGEGMNLAEQAGAAIAADFANAAAWIPVSRVRYPDGREGTFPHLIDRARPGVIAVTRGGQRFVNEADSYHDFMQALFRVIPQGEAVEAFLVCDHRCLRRYGLGFAKPFPIPLGPYLRSGYLIRGRSLEELAEKAGIAPQAFAATVADYNAHARWGEDPAFGRGATPFNRFGGDPKVTPNPCVAPVGQGPFYAIRLLSGSLGTFAGIATDHRARALRPDGTPVAGLYAVGNDMASFMRGHYPSGGITLGPAMTFGYIAGRHLAGVEAEAPEPVRGPASRTPVCP